MGERRKRKSMWDKEEETKHFAGMSENSYRTGKEHHSTHDSGQYHEFSSPGSYRAPNFRYHSGQQSLETIEDDPVSPMNGSFIKSRERVHEGREMGGESRYYQKMSPDFRSSHSLGNERSHSYRYPGRGRSRSPSRTRGRSPSRSLSRDRERERARGRSRSRSRSRGDDMAESWRNRAGHGHISRHSYSSRGSRSELRDDGSDPYYGEDDQFQNKNRSAIPCKDFIKGNCRWGDTCRFSHHFNSGETFAKGPRYMSSDKDSEQHPHKNGKPLCKYFAAGRCDRDNCWFSHEDPRFNSLEGRQGKVADEGSLRNENRNWKKPERGRNLIDRDIRPSHPARNATYGGDLGAVESVGMENMDKKQEELMLHGSSQFKNQDGNSKVQGPNRVEAEFSWEPWEDDSQVSHIQQPSRIVVENNPMSSVRSNVHDELKDPRKTADPNLLAGENLTQNGEEVFSGHSLIPSKTHIEQNLPYPNPSHLFADLQLQSQMQNHQKAIQTTEVLETKILGFFPNIVPSESTTQFTNPIVFPTHGLENEHFLKDVDTQVPNPMGMSTAQFTNPIVFPTQGLENEHSRKDVDTQVPNSMGMALFETANMQSYPAKVSDDLFNPIENERAINKPGKPAEEGKQMQVERSSPLPIAVGVPDNSEVDHSGKLKQEPVIANSVVDEGKIAPGEESKGDKNVKPTETLDGHGKNEESNANKDDKGMRLFKNSLIEFVKDILKPTWKEGRMSREVHKTIVKKVVDKVTSTIQVDHIPKTQEKVEQYLAYSQPKIAKLVQAYVGRSQKTDS